MVEQSCLTCKHRKECPKAEHFEDYYLDGCSEYEEDDDNEVL